MEGNGDDDDAKMSKGKGETSTPPTWNEPRRLIISGAPASGKGTQCENIVSTYGVVHISTGDLLRGAVREETPLGIRAKGYMEGGQLVPDDLVIDLVKEKLREDAVSRCGWLLDGFPRTPAQAQALEDAGIRPDAFILLEVPDEALVERVVGRRLDPVTGRVFHVKFNPPPPDDSALLDRLVHRADDTEEALRTRLQAYHANLQGILAFYSKVLRRVDGNRAKELVLEDVRQAIESKSQSSPAPFREEIGEVVDPRGETTNNREHEIAVHLAPVEPHEAPLSFDTFGFAREEDYLKQEKQFASELARKVLRQKVRWQAFLRRQRKGTQGHVTIPAANATVKRLCRKGIPMGLRPEVWAAMTRAQEKIEANKGYFAKILADHEGQESFSTQQIELDCTRTFPEHQFLGQVEGINQIRRVLVAFSWRNPDIGYCQSMNFVVAILLLVLKDEELAFWALTTIVEDRLLEEFYSPTMAGVHTEYRVLDALMSTKLPKLQAHFQHLNLPLVLLCNHWFLCLYTTALPTETVLRTWDAFLYEGSKVLFRVALALFKHNETRLLKALDSSEALSIAKKMTISCFDCNEIMRVAFRRIGSFPMDRIRRLRTRLRHEVEKDLRAAEEKRASTRAAKKETMEKADAVEMAMVPETSPPHQEGDGVSV